MAADRLFGIFGNAFTVSVKIVCGARHSPPPTPSGHSGGRTTKRRRLVAVVVVGQCTAAQSLLLAILDATDGNPRNTFPEVFPSRLRRNSPLPSRVYPEAGSDIRNWLFAQFCTRLLFVIDLGSRENVASDPARSFAARLAILRADAVHPCGRISGWAPGLGGGSS